MLVGKKWCVTLLCERLRMENWRAYVQKCGANISELKHNTKEEHIHVVMKFSEQKNEKEIQRIVNAIGGFNAWVVLNDKTYFDNENLAETQGRIYFDLSY